MALRHTEQKTLATELSDFHSKILNTNSTPDEQKSIKCSDVVDQTDGTG